VLKFRFEVLEDCAVGLGNLGEKSGSVDCLGELRGVCVWNWGVFGRRVDDFAALAAS
jgi:hypothetical protein